MGIAAFDKPIVQRKPRQNKAVIKNVPKLFRSSA